MWILEKDLTLDELPSPIKDEERQVHYDADADGTPLDKVIYIIIKEASFVQEIVKHLSCRTWLTLFIILLHFIYEILYTIYYNFYNYQSILGRDNVRELFSFPQ